MVFLVAATVPGAMLIKNRFYDVTTAVAMVASLPLFL
jgi:hypothetical protein